VWLVGAADAPHPKISFFRRVCPHSLGMRQGSGRGFHKPSDFVEALLYWLAWLILPEPAMLA
jgi:hypothetical protein